jgi:hypothetical protein
VAASTSQQGVHLRAATSQHTEIMKYMYCVHSPGNHACGIRIVVSTPRCGRGNLGSNPRSHKFFFDFFSFFLFAVFPHVSTLPQYYRSLRYAFYYVIKNLYFLAEGCRLYWYSLLPLQLLALLHDPSPNGFIRRI